MKICDKLSMDYDQLVKNGPVTIVAFGDSVTHGAVGDDEFNYDTVYWNRLRQKLNRVRSYVPINVINAGIGGISAPRSLDRMEEQVLRHNPDLIIVCFGLNDVNGELSLFLDSLRTIFDRCNRAQVDTIFMTPNMLNTYVHEATGEQYRDYAAVTAQLQNSGRMDAYMAAATALAEEMGITVCDCYAMWKELAKTQDTTRLLANYINHPTKELHELFAQALFDTIFARDTIEKKPEQSAMYWDTEKA